MNINLEIFIIICLLINSCFLLFFLRKFEIIKRSNQDNLEYMDEREEVNNKYNSFDERIKLLREEVNNKIVNKSPAFEEFAKSGEVYEVPEEYVPPLIYENDDVEIITDDFERRMEEKMLGKI